MNSRKEIFFTRRKEARVSGMELACIAHKAGRIKLAAAAGTAQTRTSGCDIVSRGSGFDWRTPLRQSLGLLGPAYGSMHKDFAIIVRRQNLNLGRFRLQSAASSTPHPVTYRITHCELRFAKSNSGPACRAGLRRMCARHAMRGAGKRIGSTAIGIGANADHRAARQAAKRD